MGRIAEALKRAEGERRTALQEATRKPVAGAPTLPPVEIPPRAFHLPNQGPQEDRFERSVTIKDGLAESMIPYYEPSSLISEQYRALRTRLLSQNPQYEHRVIAITSGAPKEGKSVTTVNLSSTLAEIRHLKVLAVDGDFRRSTLAKMLDLPAEPGLADVLNGRATFEEVIRETPIPNLYFIASGNTQERPATELLTAASAKQVFRQMQNDFHYTIVDTPPATTVTDVGIIGQMCSGVIVIVRINRTHQGVAKQAVKLLQVNNIPIIGCLVIGRDAPAGRYGYGYGYYYHRYYNYHDYYHKPNTGV